MIYRFVLLCIILSALVGAAYAQDDPTPIKFTVDADHAIVWHGTGDEWDNPFTDPGAVVYHDGIFHMFRNGFRGWPAKVDIGYLTSPDGLTWTEVSEDPILYAAESPFDATAILASGAIVEDDGTWVLYLYVWPRLNGPVAGSVARATAPTPTGPWTIDPTLILTVGSTGAWDDTQLTAPSVVKTDTGYVMLYSGIDSAGQWAIGMATSSDGITWAKHDNPETTDAPFAESDPVFTIADDPAAWDGVQVHQPRLRLAPDGFVMLYRGFTPGQRNQGYGLAVSDDAITWQRLNPEPAYSDKDALRRAVWYSELEYHNGTYFIYLEIARGYLNQTDIYVGTYTGSLR